MFNPIDQEFKPSSTIDSNGYPQVILAPNVGRSQPCSNSLHTQTITLPQILTEQDLTGPGRHDSTKHNRPLNTKKKNAIDGGREFLRFLPAGSTLIGSAFCAKLKEKLHCNPTKEFLIEVITEMQAQNIPNFPQLARKHKRSKTQIYSTYAPYQDLIICYILKHKLASLS